MRLAAALVDHEDPKEGPQQHPKRIGILGLALSDCSALHALLVHRWWFWIGRRWRVHERLNHFLTDCDGEAHCIVAWRGAFGMIVMGAVCVRFARAPRVAEAARFLRLYDVAGQHPTEVTG